MIDPKELRIGNCIWNSYSGTMVVVELRKDSLQARHINFDVPGSFTYEDQSPIPLTPEILEMCGFKDKNMNVEIWGNGIHVMRYPLEPNEYYFCIPDGSTLSIINESKFTSLHQLQNLYFALTGEELNYQP